MLGHTIDRCFKIIGYPQGFKRRVGNQGNKGNTGNSNFNNGKSNASSSTTVLPFTAERISKLLSLVNEKDKTASKPSVSNMGGKSLNTENNFVFNNVYSSYVNCSSVVNHEFSYNWVIVFGANQHMVMIDNDMYDCVDVSKCDLKVSHPNGTSAKVTEIET
ncbi:hypothetical protein HanIR_Chr10g0466781 [Helianthus annuus]|nr:hypothetical protein HanIR_Chr10g0466781 [Helianthus annuus]